MTETQKQVRDYLAKIGRRGGFASRREFTGAQAKKMVAIRKAKRAALEPSVGRAANITAGRAHAWAGSRALRSGISEGLSLLATASY